MQGQWPLYMSLGRACFVMLHELSISFCPSLLSASRLLNFCSSLHLARGVTLLAFFSYRFSFSHSISRTSVPPALILVRRSTSSSSDRHTLYANIHISTCAPKYSYCWQVPLISLQLGLFDIVEPLYSEFMPHGPHTDHAG